MSEPFFTNWQPHNAQQWGAEPMRLEHRLHAHPLFSFETLAELIETYPREQYALVHMGPQGSARRTWREGIIGSMPGRDVIEAIRHGRMWLNLRNIGQVDDRYRIVLDEIFDELHARVPGFKTMNRTSGILISSPRAQVYYHCDLPGQSLWQIHGQKRVYVYPAEPPFVTRQQIENIALHEVEVDMHYDQAYDRHAKVYEIGGGEMLHWPLNAPHRVENLDSLNVSMTMEYWTEEIRRRHMVTMANAIMRHKLGLNPSGMSTSGPLFWGKAAMQAGVKRAGLLKKARKERRVADFTLDHNHLGSIVDLKDAAE